MLVAVASTFLSLLASTLAAYAIERLRFKGSAYVGLGIYLAYLVPQSILFIPLATVIVQFGLFDSPLALILVFPTFLVPFCTWLLIGYFKSIPYELEECALVDGATRLQILRKITLPLAVPGLISAGIFSFTLSWNEFIYSLAFIQSEREQDRAGRDPDRARHRRRLPVGRADGRLAARLAAGGAVLLAVRRLLRLLADGRGEGIASGARCFLRASSHFRCRSFGRFAGAATVTAAVRDDERANTVGIGARERIVDDHAQVGSTIDGKRRVFQAIGPRIGCRRRLRPSP